MHVGVEEAVAKDLREEDRHAVARQLRDVDAGVAQALHLADRHAVHALHHDHVLACTGPRPSRAPARGRGPACCGAAARRWRPRAPGRARRAGTCRTRRRPRAASAACRRPTAARPSARACASARGRRRSRASMPGPQHLDRDLAAVAAAPRSAPARSTRSRPARRRSSRRPRRSAGRTRVSTSCARDRGRKRRHAVLQLRELVGEVGRQQVAPRRQHLAELDEDRAEPLEAEPQALAARRVEAAPDRHHANQQPHPALAKARQRELVEPVAQYRDADEDEPGDVPHRGGGPADPVGATDRCGGRAADRAHRLAQAVGHGPREPADLARRRGADDARQIVLDVPAQVVDQPVRRRPRTRRRRRSRRSAARRSAPARSASAGFDDVDLDAQLGGADGGVVAAATRPGRPGVTRNATTGKAGSSDGQPLKPIRTAEPLCARSRVIATGSAAST